MALEQRLLLLELLLLVWSRPITACDVDCGPNGTLDKTTCACICDAWHDGELCESGILGGIISGFLLGFFMAGAVGALIVIKWYMKHIQGIFDEEDEEVDSESSDVEEGKRIGTPTAPKHVTIKSGYSTVQSSSYPAGEDADGGVSSRGGRSAADALGRELETVGGLRKSVNKDAWRWGARPPSDSDEESSSKGTDEDEHDDGNGDSDEDSDDDNGGDESSEDKGTAEESSSGSESSVEPARGYQGPMGGAPVVVRGMGSTEVVSVSPVPRDCSTPTAGGSLCLTLTISCDPGRFQVEWSDATVVASRSVEVLAMPEQSLVERDLEEHGIFTIASGTVENVQKYYLFSERLAGNSMPGCVFLTELIIDGSGGSAKPQLSLTLKTANGTDGDTYLEHLNEGM